MKAPTRFNEKKNNNANVLEHPKARLVQDRFNVVHLKIYISPQPIYNSLDNIRPSDDWLIDPP